MSSVAICHVCNSEGSGCMDDILVFAIPLLEKHIQH